MDTIAHGFSIGSLLQSSSSDAQILRVTPLNVIQKVLKRWITSSHFCNISLMRPTPLWFISNYIWLRLLSNCLVVAWPRLALLIMYAKIVSCSICPGNANHSANVGVHRILLHWMKPHPLAHLGVAKTHIPARFLRCSSWKFYIGSLVAKHPTCAHVHVK